MKRYVLILVAAMSMFGTAMAQSNSQTILGAKVDIHEFEYHNDNVVVNLDFDFKDLKLGVNRSAVFAPKIFKGNMTAELPTMVVKRRGGAKSYKRAHVLENEKSIETFKKWYGDPYEVIELYGSERRDNARYSVSIPYETWMVNSELYLDCSTCGCCTSENNGVMIPRDNKLLIDVPAVEAFNLVPQIALVQPEKVAVKKRDIQYSSMLIFRVNSTYIDPNLENNKHELESIDEMVQLVLSDPDYTIRKVKIIGYASPEGTVVTNMNLSKGRAHALENLMLRKYKSITSDMYSLEYGGENWIQLYEIVSRSDYPWRDDVLHVIDNVAIEGGRERRLMEVDGGVPYKYLLKNIFPTTRVVLIDVEFDVKAYDMEHIKMMIDTKPENLSLDEMYRLSSTYSVEDAEFENIFLTAAKVYPEDETAQNNALVTEIRRGNLESVEDIVSRVDENTKSGELANSLGAYYMMMGDYDKARFMFKRSAMLGCESAEYNMGQLDKKLENMRQIEENEEFRIKIYGE